MRYGTLDSNGRPVYFAGTIYVDGKPVANPTREMYLANGQKPFLDGAKPPAAAGSGLRYIRDGWIEQAAAIVPKWCLVSDRQPRRRIFSKLKVVAALTTAGVWDAVKQLLIERGLYDLYLAAQEFAEDNRDFVRGKAALQTALGWTDEQVEAVLAASAKEGA